MKKLLFLTVIVIILVCLNWFSTLVAQDLSSLTTAEKEVLRKQVAAGQISIRGQGIENNNQYKSSNLFDSAVTARLPVPVEDNRSDSLKLDSASRLDGIERKEQFQTNLTPFEDLKPFGIELFRGPAEQTPPDDIATDENYILGPGDNVIVYLWGRVEKEYDLTLDRQGSVFVPKAGEISSWGMSIAEFEMLLKKKLSKVYSDFELTVSLGKIRSIRIYLTGEVRRPGAYSVSSLTSLYNALYLAGGPNERGTMRDIRLMRGGKLVASVDLYQFLLSGDNSSDLRLQTGDAIFVPVAGRRVAVRGEVTRPAIYEFSNDETTADLLKLAGGATPIAHLERVMLETISSAGEWEVIDLNLRESGSHQCDSRLLNNGDRITVYSIFEFKKNMVSIFGHVKHAGYYERNDSTRLSDIIGRAQLQEYDVHYNRANLFRRHSDWRTEMITFDLGKLFEEGSDNDLLLHDRDSVHIYSISDVSYDRFVGVLGEVRNPGEYKYYDKMTLSDLIFLSGSFTRAASRLQAEIARVNLSGEVTLLYANLGNEKEAMTLLQESDRVYIRPIPMWQLHRAVEISGSVRFPGEYILSDNTETLYQLLKRVDGFTVNAFPEGTIFERQSIGETLERLKVPSLLERSSPVERDSLGRLRRNILFEYESKSVNRLIIDFRAIVESGGTTRDIVLEPGDKIYVPSRPSGISVLGAVGAQGTIALMEGQKVRDYIKMAGNFTPNADKGNTRLIRANGAVCAGRGTMGKNIETGDVIVVPSKIKEKHNFMKSLGTILTTTTGILTTILLIDRI